MFSKDKNSTPPDALSDTALQKRLKTVTYAPARVEKWFRRGIQIAAIAGMIAAVFAATALGLGSIGEIGFVLLLGAGLVAGKALHNHQQDKWEDEYRTLRVEEKERPARMQRMAHSLKESFIAAMTGGTNKDIKVQPPLKLRKDASSQPR